MDTLRTGVFLLCGLLVPASCADVFFTDPVICYFLDAFLMVYCIAATALFFREKFSKIPPVEDLEEDDGGVYQELERPADPSPYQVLQPPKGRKKGGRKKKSPQNRAQQEEQDPYESLSPRATPAPRPPR
ncbi:unnamed protein product [Menidia menidia]|uniref:(Atlantic silverside) hypothetical protein n=1 Tax=Menidia menidia TaxID=238744 RepID=A0A8S4AAP7_9TELE|nr:unnamed protein product [Menidia menidia]